MAISKDQLRPERQLGAEPVDIIARHAGRDGDKRFQWIDVKTTKPMARVPIEMTGVSGYVAPHDRFVISGYYDPEYRPRSPWLDSTGTCTSEMGWNPTHWRYLMPGPDAVS